MKRTVMVVGVALNLVAGATRAAELRLEWQGQTNTVMVMAVGDTAIIDIWITLSSGDALVGIGFNDEPVAELAQTGAAPDGSLDWTNQSTNGAFLGDLGQTVSFFTGSSGVLNGPGEFLLGSQTVSLTSAGDGSDLEIAINMGNLTLIRLDGSFYVPVASGSAMENAIGFVHLGTGSPGYTALNEEDVREPLIVRQAGSGGGGSSGGGGGGGGGGNTNTNTNTNDNANANDNGGTNDNTNSNANDNINANDNSNGNGNGNGNENGNGNANDNANGNANDNANTGGNDNSLAGNLNDNGSGGNTNDNGSGGSGSGGSSTISGPCGVGVVGMMPVALLGLLAFQAGRRGYR